MPGFRRVLFRSGIASHLIQSADDIDPAWLDGVSCVGVTAGASTPEFLVQQVLGRLQALDAARAGKSEISSLPQVDEGVTFKLPPGLRP